MNILTSYKISTAQLFTWSHRLCIETWSNSLII